MRLMDMTGMAFEHVDIHDNPWVQGASSQELVVGFCTDAETRSASLGGAFGTLGTRAIVVEETHNVTCNRHAPFGECKTEGVVKHAATNMLGASCVKSNDGFGSTCKKQVATGTRRVSCGKVHAGGTHNHPYVETSALRKPPPPIFKALASSHFFPLVSAVVCTHISLSTTPMLKPKLSQSLGDLEPLGLGGA